MVKPGIMWHSVGAKWLMQRVLTDYKIDGRTADPKVAFESSPEIQVLCRSRMVALLETEITNTD